MKILLKLLMVLPIMACLTSCSEEDLGSSIFDISGEKVLNATDLYLKDTYTDPYNVSVIYRWKETETDMSFNLIPPFLDKVEPIMHVVDTTYLEPYNKIAGSDFTKSNVPKQFLLIGSPGINPNNGTEVLGTAEGGVKVLLYKVNQFDRSKPATYDDILHTIHHEFAHVLHQKKLYDESYKKITPNDYTATWYNFADSTANSKGFITAYAMASTDEDFAEMVGLMLLNSKASWDAQISTMAGKDFIKQKEDYVVRYFKEKWKIDFYDLQHEVSGRINALAVQSLPTPLFGVRSTRTECACHNHSKHAAPATPVTHNKEYEKYIIHILDTNEPQ